MIVGVPAHDLLQHMDSLRPFLENFAKRSLGRWTVDGLTRAILQREKQVWNIRDWQAACLTSLSEENVNIEAAAGIRRHEWQAELDNELRAWGRALGKKRVIALVRPGWAKFGKAQGYREAHREMVVEI